MYITMCTFKFKDKSYYTMKICLIWFIFSFSSMISALNLTYLVICDSNYPRVLAFAFLDEVQREFLQSNERSYVESVTRPYALIQFGGWRDTSTTESSIPHTLLWLLTETYCYRFYFQIHILFADSFFFMFIYIYNIITVTLSEESDHSDHVKLPGHQIKRDMKRQVWCDDPHLAAIHNLAFWIKLLHCIMMINLLYNLPLKGGNNNW